MDCLEEIAARRDDWLDELPVGVLVAAIDELGEPVDPVGSLVVDALEIERTKWIVRRPDDEEAKEPTAPVLERITYAGGFERGQRVGRVPAEIAALGAELVRPALWRQAP